MHFDKPDTVEPPKMDSPYYRNLHNADKSLWSRIIPCTIVYVHKKTSVLRTPPKKGHFCKVPWCPYFRGSTVHGQLKPQHPPWFGIEYLLQAKWTSCINHNMNMCIVHACLPFVVYTAAYQESSQSTQETRSKQQVQPRHYKSNFHTSYFFLVSLSQLSKTTKLCPN